MASNGDRAKKSEEHALSLFYKCMSDIEAFDKAVELLREHAKREFCVNESGKNLTCSCFRQLLDAEHGVVRTNGVARFIVDFSKRTKEEKRNIVMDLIRQSKQHGPAAPRHKFKMPMILDDANVYEPSIVHPLVCRSFIMCITGMSNYHWKTWSGFVRTNMTPPAHHGLKGKASNPAAATACENYAALENKRRKLETPATEKHKRRERDELDAILEMVRPGSKPVIFYVRGNAAKREEGRKWLDKARPRLKTLKKAQEEAEASAGRQVRRKSTQENYGGFQSGMPDPHVYGNFQFYSKELLEDGCAAIKPLGDAIFSVELEHSHKFDGFVGDEDGFLRGIANEAIHSIKDKWEFQGAAIRGMSEEQQGKWRQKYQSLGSKPSPSELLEANQNVLDDPLKFTFQAASLHDQTDGTEKQISAYYSHRDKVGNLVCFCPLEGDSFNFVSMQSKYVKGACNGRKEKARFEQSHGYKKYQAYKSSLTETDLLKVNNFESDFMKTATDLRQPQVHVYRLMPADKLIFTARDYLHGTIIPKRDNGILRALLIFHDLIPYK